METVREGAVCIIELDRVDIMEYTIYSMEIAQP